MKIWKRQLYIFLYKERLPTLRTSLKLCLSSKASCPFYLHFHYRPNFSNHSGYKSQSFVTVFFPHSPTFQHWYSKISLTSNSSFSKFLMPELSLSSGIFEQPLMISIVFNVFPFLSGLHTTTYIIFLKCRFVTVFSLIKKKKREEFNFFQ